MKVTTLNIKILNKIIKSSHSNQGHFDTSLAKEFVFGPQTVYISLYIKVHKTIWELKLNQMTTKFCTYILGICINCSDVMRSILKRYYNIIPPPLLFHPLWNNTVKKMAGHFITCIKGLKTIDGSFPGTKLFRLVSCLVGLQKPLWSTTPIGIPALLPLMSIMMQLAHVSPHGAGEGSFYGTLDFGQSTVILTWYYFVNV